MAYNENNKSAKDESLGTTNYETATKAKLPTVKQIAFKATCQLCLVYVAFVETFSYANHLLVFICRVKKCEMTTRFSELKHCGLNSLMIYKI